MLFFLIQLLLILSLLEVSHQKRPDHTTCAHDHQDIDYNFLNIPLEVDNQRALQGTSSSYKGIRIFFDYSRTFWTHSEPFYWLSPLEMDQNQMPFLNYIQNSIIPPVKSLLEASIKVLPLTQNIIIKESSICGESITPPSFYKKKGISADLIIFINTNNDSNSQYVATASFCTLNLVNNR